ncbi:nickel pincer cofactor biosynthesis protein LarB [Synechococcus sp. M16CYN]|uniref:nickel pincer cofactor biosynthesis protein LarB n=1 Tax=Synechococcus sp. M16CYN TaxID=3103139 RepID=UPI0030E44081
MLDDCLDLQRRQRLGMVEAIWGEHKTVDQVVAILKQFEEAGELGLVTRVDVEKAEAILSVMPQVMNHVDARCLTVGSLPKLTDMPAAVTVISGGSSDRTVVAEATLALHCHGIHVDSVTDVGVAGLHRLLDQLPVISSAKVLIACAGMEGALPTVLAGLMPQPVIGVPVSVGYGVSKGGRTALEGMLASCAPGLLVTNIDNGYGAAMAALRIVKECTRATRLESSCQPIL